VHQILYDGDPADANPALFNLAKDPAEQHDVSKDNPAVVERLNGLFTEWRREVHAEAASKQPAALPTRTGKQ
jgi:hypothetical protein